MRAFAYNVVSVLALAALVGSAAPARCADAPTKPSAPERKAHGRTIKSMIDLALKDGIKEKLPANFAQWFQLPEGAAQRIISYGDDKTPDHRQHDFAVVVDDKGHPGQLLWTNMTVQKQADGEFQEHTTYLTTLSGSLKMAVHAQGMTGKNVAGARINEKNPATAAAFKKDREFILVDAIHLPFEKE